MSAPSIIGSAQPLLQTLTGNSVYFYPNNDIIGSSSTKLQEFNGAAKQTIQHMYLYGAYTSYNSNTKKVVVATQEITAHLAAIPSINQFRVHVIVEGDPSILESKPTDYAYAVATALCGLDIAGITFEMAPMPKYIDFLDPVMETLGKLVLSDKRKCVSDRYPHGRWLSVFAGSQYVAQFTRAMGKNGFFIMNGYDLGDVSGLAPTEYKTLLRYQINNMLSKLSTPGYFTIAIPAAASTMEYSSFQDLNTGEIIQNKYKTFANGNGYVEASLEAVKEFMPNMTGRYIGTTLWAVTGAIKSGNRSYFPASMFDIAGETQYLQNNIPSIGPLSEFEWPAKSPLEDSSGFTSYPIFGLGVALLSYLIL